MVLGITPFADMTLQEFSDKIKGKLSNDDNSDSDEYAFDKIEDSNFKTRFLSEKVYDSNYFDKYADADEEPETQLVNKKDVSASINKVYDSNYFDKYADADEEPNVIITKKPKVKAVGPSNWKEYLLQKPQTKLKCNQDSVYFAFADLLEAEINYSEDIKEPLSVQSLIDCVSKYEERCKTTEISSGVFTDAKLKIGGIPKESEYGSYADGEKQVCKKSTPFVDWISEESCLEPERANEKKYACNAKFIDEIITQGPYITRIDHHNRNFQLYKGGFLRLPNCKAIESVLTVLVFSVSEKTVEFKSYLGEDWGDNGFAKIRRSDKTCGLTNLAATVSGASAPAPD